MGSSLDDIKAFPAAARREIGYQLYKVQHGLEPSDWKPMAGLDVASARLKQVLRERGTRS